MRLKNEPIWEKDGFILRPGRETDAEAYYAQNFNPLDPEVARMTGSRTEFSRDTVVSYFLRCLDDPERVDFLLIAPNGEIIGESVINEIDWETRRGNFRIGIFRPDFRGRGIGTWMVETTRDFAFEVLKLHRLELDVYSFNPRAERAYEKAGFRREGVLRDAIRDGACYADAILMALLEGEWREQRENQK